MSWHDVLATVESSVISAVVFIAVGYLVAKVKLIPLFRKHKAELMAAIREGGAND